MSEEWEKAVYKKVRSQVERKPIFQVPISGACGANAEVTYLGGLMSIPFKILGAVICFPDTAINNVRASLLHAQDANTSTAGLPSGENIFSRYSPQGYFIGHDETIKVDCDIEVEGDKTRLKLHINNMNAWASIIQAIIKVQLI